MPDLDQEELAERETFFRELESRHGGPISYEQLREWDLADFNVDKDELEETMLVNELSPSADATAAAMIPMTGWLTPLTTAPDAPDSKHLAPPRLAWGGSKLSLSSTALAEACKEVDDEQVDDCVITASMGSRIRSRLDVERTDVVTPPRRSLAGEGPGPCDGDSAHRYVFSSAPCASNTVSSCHHLLTDGAAAAAAAGSTHNDDSDIESDMSQALFDSDSSFDASYAVDIFACKQQRLSPKAQESTPSPVNTASPGAASPGIDSSDTMLHDPASPDADSLPVATLSSLSTSMDLPKASWLPAATTPALLHAPRILPAQGSASNGSNPCVESLLPQPGWSSGPHVEKSRSALFGGSLLGHSMPHTKPSAAPVSGAVLVAQIGGMPAPKGIAAPARTADEADEVARENEVLAAHETQLRRVGAEARQLHQQLREALKKHEEERGEWRKHTETLQAALALSKRQASIREHVAAGGQLRDLSLSVEELAQLERDVREQEAIIAGYQKENERLSKDLKVAQDAAKAELARREDEVNRLQLRLAEAEENRGVRAEEAQRKLIERAHERAAEAEARASEREAEMRFELDKLRVAKRELEGQLAGVDVKQMAAVQSEQQATTAALERAGAEHQAELGRLQSKLNWYMENQRLIDEVEAEAEAAKARLREFEAKARGTDGGLDSPPEGVHDDAKHVASNRAQSQSHVVALEKQVKQLQQQILLQRRPQSAKGPKDGAASVSDLVAAAGPSAEEIEERTYLEGRVAALEEQLTKADSATQRRLRALRQQSERVSASYEQRISALQAALDKYEGAGAKGSAAMKVRVRELEKQIDEIRSTHSKRVRELEARLADALKVKEPSCRLRKDSRSTPSVAAGEMAATSAGSVGAQSKPRRPQQLPSSMQQPPQQQQQPPPQLSSAVAGDASKAPPRLHLHLGEPLCHSTDTLESKGCAGEPVNNIYGWVAAARAETALEQILARVGGMANQLQFESEVLAEGLFSGEALPTDVPLQLQLQLMHEQMRALELKHQRRQQESHALIEQTRRLAVQEAARVRNHYEGVLGDKNAEIEQFRGELDAIMHEMQLMYERQQQHAYGLTHVAKTS